MKTLLLLALNLLLTLGSALAASPGEIREWVDRKTGHRVVRISPEPYSMLPYFSANIFSADGKRAAYISGRGIHLLELDNMTSRLLVPARAATLQVIAMGRKNPRLYYVARLPGDRQARICSIDLDTGNVAEHARVPVNYRLESVNADETLMAGVYEEPTARKTPERQLKRGEILYSRYKEAIPMTVVAVDLRTGTESTVYSSTEWLSHVQFSPADPALLMYSLEGPWHLVDRIWTIRVDGSDRKLIHRRTLDMEIAGHEFWSEDGRYIHYDWQYPKGKTFYLASHEVATGTRRAIPLTRSQWSVHFNASRDPVVFAGDGAHPGQASKSPDSRYILLYRATGDAQNPTAMESTALVDLIEHDYRLEPNARLTPDNRWILFRSNIFGVPEIFAVATDRNNDGGAPIASTSEISRAAKANRNALLLQQ